MDQSIHRIVFAAEKICTPLVANGLLTNAALSHKYYSHLDLDSIDLIFFSILQKKTTALLNSIDIHYAGIKYQPMTQSRKIQSIVKWLMNMLY